MLYIFTFAVSKVQITSILANMLANITVWTIILYLDKAGELSGPGHVAPLPDVDKVGQPSHHHATYTLADFLDLFADFCVNYFLHEPCTLSVIL